MRRSRMPLAARLAIGGLCAAMATLGLGAAGAASASTNTGRTWQVLVGAQAGNHAIQTMGFYPSHLWVDQGDRVVFKANSAEIHTVTFLSKADPCPETELCALPPQGFNPGDMRQSTRQGTHTYDGSGYYNSGILSATRGDTGPLPPFVQVYHRYTLRFPDSLAPGTYRYYCLVHGKPMQGSVIVQAKGTPYPYGQKLYQQRVQHGITRDIRDGYALWKSARAQDRQLTHQSGHPTVLVGAMDDRAMVMRFIHSHVRIHAGRRVTFVNTGMGEPHTVTFGDDQTGCGQPPCNPEQPWNVAMRKDGQEKAVYPGHNGGFTGDRKNLNSGLLLGGPTAMTGVPNSLTIRFRHAGTFDYVCALHDYMGMVGSVRVEPRS